MTTIEPQTQGVKPPAPYYSDDLVTLYHGDCREVLPQLDVSVDLLATDPPYGLDIGYGRTALGTRRIEGDADDALLTGVLADCDHLMSENAWAAVFCGYTHSGKVQVAAETAGWRIKTVIVWDKAMPSLGEGIRNQHELAVLAKRGRPTGLARLLGGHRLMRPEDAWGTWNCPLCTEVIAVNPYLDHGLLEMRMHSDAHVEANDDYLMGLI